MTVWDQYDLDLDLSTMKGRELFRSHLLREALVPIPTRQLLDLYYEESDEHETEVTVEDFTYYLKAIAQNMIAEAEAIYSTLHKQRKAREVRLLRRVPPGRCGMSLGRALWVWVPDLQCYIPTCIRKRGDRRCGNGPLTGDAIQTGDCGEDHASSAHPR